MREPSCLLGLLVGAFLLLAAVPARAAGPPPAEPLPVEPASGELCAPALAAAERAQGLPPQILRSIGLVESGRVDPGTGRVVPWPWAINVGGTGLYFPGKQEAMDAVRRFQSQGARSIDVGCAQVNLMHHPHAFASLDEAFDPAANAAYAARFLRLLHGATGSWPLAVAAYHSQTPELGYPYARRVLAVWPGSARYGSLPDLPNPIVPKEIPLDFFTPEFAAQIRRNAQALHPARETRRTNKPAAQGPALVWINRPPRPTPLNEPGALLADRSRGRFRR